MNQCLWNKFQINIIQRDDSSETEDLNLHPRVQFNRAVYNHATCAWYIVIKLITNMNNVAILGRFPV